MDCPHVTKKTRNPKYASGQGWLKYSLGGKTAQSRKFGFPGMPWTGQLPFPTSGQWRMVVRSPLRRSPLKVGFLLYLTVTCLLTYLHQSVLVCVVILGGFSHGFAGAQEEFRRNLFPAENPLGMSPRRYLYKIIQERMRTGTQSAQNQRKAQYSTFSSECSKSVTCSPHLSRAWAGLSWNDNRKLLFARPLVLCAARVKGCNQTTPLS